jgi:hypothetical protein
VVARFRAGDGSEHEEPEGTARVHRNRAGRVTFCESATATGTWIGYRLEEQPADAAGAPGEPPAPIEPQPPAAQPTKPARPKTKKTTKRRPRARKAPPQ